MAQVISCEFCKISKNAFSYRTYPVATFKIKSSITQVFQVQCSSIDSHDVLKVQSIFKQNQWKFELCSWIQTKKKVTRAFENFFFGRTKYIFLIFYKKKTNCTKIKFSIKNFFNRCDRIRRKLRICSHLLKKSLMENFIFAQWQNPGWCS